MKLAASLSIIDENVDPAMTRFNVTDTVLDAGRVGDLAVELFDAGDVGFIRN